MQFSEKIGGKYQRDISNSSDEQKLTTSLLLVNTRRQAERHASLQRLYNKLKTQQHEPHKTNWGVLI